MSRRVLGKQTLELRQRRLRRGGREFGHYTDREHNCDSFCYPPTREELEQAGIDPPYFRIKSRVKRIK